MGSYLKKSGMVIAIGMVVAAAAVAAPPRKDGVVVPFENDGFTAARSELQQAWEEANRRAAETSTTGAEAAVSAGMGVKALSAGGPYYCLPSCSAIDGRMLSLAGQGFNTLAGDRITLEFGAGASASTLEIGLFDPDTSGTWDSGSFGAGLGLHVDVYADPDGDASGSGGLVASWIFDSSYNGHNNAWFTHVINVGSSAKAPSGNYLYTMVITNPDPSKVVSSSFKVRTTGSLVLKPQAFAYIVPLLSPAAEAPIIYPSWPSLSPTTYNGRFDIHMLVGSGQVPQTEIWDGDMDHGAANCSTADTDDPDTPNAPFLPAWAVGTAATYEGVAQGSVQGCGTTTGTPNDDAASPIFARSPSVYYEIEDPLYASSGGAVGSKYTNANPSGNLEWEQFVYGTGGFPAGVWHVDVIGCDTTNLNAWRAPYDVICVKDAADPNAELQPCDTVYCACCGTGTIGYWKNHKNAWPRPYFTIGGAPYTVSQAIAIMKCNAGSDMTYKLYWQLAAAMMNVYSGTDPSCIAADIDAANLWLAAYPVGSRVRSSSAAWYEIKAIHARLDKYNNGELCAPHRDDVRCGGGGSCR